MVPQIKTMRGYLSEKGALSRHHRAALSIYR